MTLSEDLKLSCDSFGIIVTVPVLVVVMPRANLLSDVNDSIYCKLKLALLPIAPPVASEQAKVCT